MPGATIRAFTFDITKILEIRRGSAPEPLGFISPSAGARYDYALEGGPLEGGAYPAGTVFQITTSVTEIDGIVPGLFFVAGGVQTSTTAINSVGDDQPVTMDPTTDESTDTVSERAITGTTATWPKIIIDATLPE